MPQPSVLLRRVLAPRGLALALGLALAGCALAGGTLGGRERCWPEDQQLGASLWRGTLRIDASGGRLDTPEGDVIPLLPGTLNTRVSSSGVGELVRGTDAVAKDGDEVTLFGGMGSSGALVVCSVDEVHARS